MKHLLLKLSPIALIFAFSGMIVVAQSTPPSGNIPAPINASNVDQGKTGGLRIGGALSSALSTGEKLEVLNGTTNIVGNTSVGYALLNYGSAIFEGAGLGLTGNTVNFLGPIGTNASHVHYGTTGDWYIRSALPTGKVILQDTGGNVGIGTSQPTATLTVNGSSLFGAESSTGGGVIYLANTNTFIRSLTGSVRLGVAGAATALVVNPVGTQSGLAVSAGSVNIGGNSTTTPANYTVNVNGTANATNWKGETLKIKAIQFTPYIVTSTNSSQITPTTANGIPTCTPALSGRLIMASSNVSNEMDVLATCTTQNWLGNPQYSAWWVLP